jgi:mono/diheme cytochrome c family protein
MKPRVVALALTGALILGIGALAFLTRARLTPVERGRRLAEATGCFACHGAEGIRGMANPGRDEKQVPSFEGTLMMYAKNPEEVREWIRDGGTKTRREDPDWQAERKLGVVRMPAFGRRLRASQIEDLVAYVVAVGGQNAPDDSLASHGKDRADELGCVGCHGPGGRLARANPGSLKGYIPPWDGADFTELVSSETEFREWVEDGVGHRFRSNPVAQFFLRRAPLHMPAFKKHLAPGDVEALWAYVTWLRAQPEDQPH